MAHQVYFQQLSFQKAKDGEPTIPDGDPVVVKRGELVPAWVPTWQLAALANAGMILPVADEPRDDLAPLTEAPEAPRTPDQPAILPSNPNSLPFTPEPVAPVVPVEDTATLPKDSDRKEVWERFAQTPRIGMGEAEAEGMSKTELVAEVKRRNAIAAPAE